MKYLQKLNVRNLKGQSGTFDLAPVTVVAGDNMSGKTAVLQAVRLALLGYEPGLGKRPGDTKLLGSGASFSVSAFLSDGSLIDRGWRVERGSVKQDGKAEPSVPAELLDVGEYFGKTGPARVSYILGKVDVAALGFSDDALTAELKGVRVDGHGEAHETALRSALSIVDNLMQERDENGHTVQAFLEACVEDLKDKQKEAEAVVKNMAGSAAAQTQLRAQEMTGHAQKPTADQVRQARDAFAAAHQRQVDIQRMVSDHALFVERRGKLTARRSTLPVTDTAPLLAKVAELEPVVGQSSRTPGLQAAFAEVTRRSALAEADVKAIRRAYVDLRERFNRDLAAECCPHCGTPGAGFRDALTAKFNRELAEVETKLADAELLEVAVCDELIRAKANFALASSEDASRETARREWVDLTRKLRDAKDTEAEAGKLDAMLEQLGAEPPLPSPEAVHKARLDCDNARTFNDQLDALVKQATRAEQDALRQEQARVEQAAAQAEADVFKAAVKKLAAFKEKLVVSAFDGLVAKARRFTNGILRGVLDHRDGELGMATATGWVDHRTFSGTEQMLAYAGLAVALADGVDCRVVLMDELGRLDAGNKAKLSGRMVELVREGVIDQFIGADASAMGYEAAFTAPEFKLVSL